MRGIGWALLSAALLHAETPQVKRGAEIFQTTCSVAYCHGANGTAGRAPQLAGRAFKAGEVFNLVMYGRPGTSMPGFEKQMKSDDVEAVAQYVASLSGPAAVAAAKPGVRQMPGSLDEGKTLFFDAVRMGGCGKCHEQEERGSPVGPDLSALAPEKFRNLRAISAAHIVTAKPIDEGPFPGLAVEQTAEIVRVYDLGSPLPVLRTFQPAQVHITPGGAWPHAAAIQNYSDAELEAISGYLSWVAQAGTSK
jgi:mono/diheme cytochrome c family protein